ncbi:immunoglobulin-like domain-containing protein [Clostridium sp. AUH-JLR23]|uniref:immunoglobulin-like domain-containing protein n=1 Tax=Clostridium sp. AUH-JLR23 TaxID=1505062 RepID=UPI003564043E
MNLTKRLTAWFLTLVMVVGLIPQTVFAQVTAASLLQYEVTQEVNEDKTEATISIKFTETETIQLEKVTLPDGTEKVEDLSEVTYTVSENGKYDFKVNYVKDDTPQEETIPVEVSGLEEKKAKEVSIEENLTHAENDSNLSKASGNTYEVSTDDQLKSVLKQIEENQDAEATIVLTADIGDQTKFVGVANKSITVKSTEGQKYALTLGNYLEGDITIDNVKVSSGTLYCNGHRTIFTENCDFSIGSLFGGANEQNVDSVYVKINGKGVINSGSSELVITGGCYKGSVDGDLYMEIDGNIDIKASAGGHYISGGSKETRYGGDTYTGDPLYVKGDLTFIIGLNNISSTHNLSGTHNTHVYGNLNLIVKHGTFTGIDGQRENPKKAIVDGNINMVVGDPNEELPVYVTWNWGIVGAGEKIANSQDLYKVGKDVNITTYENVWCWKPGQKPVDQIGGLTGVESAQVQGNVNIQVNGSHLKDIIGVNTGMYYNNPTIQGNLKIEANDAHLESPYTECFIYSTTDETFIHGNVDITMNGGRTNQISTYQGTIDGKVAINLTGRPTITNDVIGKHIDNSSPSDESILNINQGTLTIPQGIWYFNDVNITNQSDVTLGNTEKHAFRPGIYDINITDSSLTTNNQAYSKGAVTMDHGTWVANGRLYVTNTTNTNDSNIVMNDYAAFGYGHKDDAAYSNTVVTSNNDTYTFNKNDYTDNIYGNAEITGSTWSVFVPTIIGGNYNATTSKLNLLAFTGDENYPDEKIPLEILGIATGSTAVTLVDKNDTSKEGKPIVGQNYINALKTSEKTFELANENAKSEGLYFKKLADADTKDKVDYDMWQVAKKDAYRVLYSFESGTSEKSLPDEIIDLLPTDSKKYYEGNTITAEDPSQLEFEVTDGVWTFEGYDADSKIANTDNVNEDGYIQFTGTWVFKKNASIINLVPTISASDKTLTVGDKFDPLKDVTAMDKEDGDITLTNDNIIKNDVDTTKSGIYEVTYKVTDSQGASTIKKIYVTVNPKMEGLNQIPVINAEDKTINVGDKFDPLKDVTATDKEDGDITKEIEILNNEVDTNKAGVYEVTYKVTDSQGASAVKTIKVTVKDKDTPVVPGEPDKPNKPDDTNKPVIVPDTSVNDKNPQTGDSTNMTLWALLFIASSVGLVSVYRKKRKVNQ